MNSIIYRCVSVFICGRYIIKFSAVRWIYMRYKNRTPCKAMNTDKFDNLSVYIWDYLYSNIVQFRYLSVLNANYVCQIQFDHIRVL